MLVRACVCRGGWGVAVGAGGFGDAGRLGCRSLTPTIEITLPNGEVLHRRFASLLAAAQAYPNAVGLRVVAWGAFW